MKKSLELLSAISVCAHYTFGAFGRISLEGNYKLYFENNIKEPLLLTNWSPDAALCVLANVAGK